MNLILQFIDPVTAKTFLTTTKDFQIDKAKYVDAIRTIKRFLEIDTPESPEVFEDEYDSQYFTLFSKSSNISLSFIKSSPRRWDWNTLTERFASMEIDLSLPWNREILSRYVSLHLMLHPDFPLTGIINYNKNLYPKFISDNPNLPWDWGPLKYTILPGIGVDEGLSRKVWKLLPKYHRSPAILSKMPPDIVEAHENITSSVLKKVVRSYADYLRELPVTDANFDKYARFIVKYGGRRYLCNKIPWRIQKNNLSSIDWFELSDNVTISDKIVRKYINKPWYWDRLARNKNITVSLILEHFAPNYALHDKIYSAKMGKIPFELLPRSLHRFIGRRDDLTEAIIDKYDIELCEDMIHNENLSLKIRALSSGGDWFALTRIVPLSSIALNLQECWNWDYIRSLFKGKGFFI